MENALRDSEERFRSLYENTTIGMYRTSIEGRILMANPALLRMLGYESFESLSVRDLSTEGYEPGYPRQDFQNLMEKDGEIRGLESAWKRKDNSIIFVRESARLVRDEKGHQLYYEGTVEDVTERRQAEEAMRASEEKFRTIAEQMTDVIYLTDQTGVITFVSPAVTSIFGYLPGEMQGKVFTDFLDETSIPSAVAAFKDDVSTGQSSRNLELMMKRKDGTIFLGELNGRFYRKTNISGTIGLIHDITERKQTQTLQEAVYRIATAAETTGSMDELYPQIHQIISSVMPAENFFITLYDEAQNLLRFPYFKDAEDEPFMGGSSLGRG